MAKKVKMLSVPSFRALGNGQFELMFDFDLEYRGEKYRVPAGFVTDGASIPFALRSICGDPFDVPRIYAAIVHDYLYSGGDAESTRADADDLYRDLQIAFGLPRWKAYVEWFVLRLFGGSHYYE